MPVLDASVVVDCIAPDVAVASPALRTLARLSTEGAELIGPRLLLSECADALLTGVRKGRFYQEFGPASRTGTADREAMAAIFAKHDMALLGPPLTGD